LQSATSTTVPEREEARQTTISKEKKIHSTEEVLAVQLQNHNRLASKRLLERTYEHLLLGSTNAKPPVLARDKLFTEFGAGLRATVESYMGEYGAESVSGTEQGISRGIGRYRKALEDNAMRAAFTLRECKVTHEQKSLIQAALIAKNSIRLPGSLVDEGTRKRRVEAMASDLQERQNERDGKLLDKARRKILVTEKETLVRTKAVKDDRVKAAALNEKLHIKEKKCQNAHDRELEQRERMRSIEREKLREKTRRLAKQKEREKELKKEEEEMRKARMMETSEEALYRLYEPIFRALWDMEFSNLHNTNPFRMIINVNNCAGMGCPDYCDVIKNPMNLTYIKEKVNAKKYETLQEFFEDVKLLINNALIYNSDPNNAYHIAANVMKRKFLKLGEEVMNEVQQQQHQK